MSCNSKISEADIHELESERRIDDAKATMLRTAKRLRGFGDTPDVLWHSHLHEQFIEARDAYLEAVGVLCKCGLPAGACDCGMKVRRGSFADSLRQFPEVIRG